MSVVGADIGTLSSVIAVARNRGVDVITNEVSNRSTPSLVGFGPKCRYLGEPAKTQEISNLKNTVSSLKRLIGRTINDTDVEIEKQYVSAPLVDINGQVGAEVTYLGKKETFTATQLMAMYLSKIKSTTSHELKAPVSDIVLGCPAWFTDSQRRAMLDAAEIAGLKTLRLLNETTAVALGYGITKQDLPAAGEKPRRICFVDIGHSSYSCSIVEFRKAELVVKATTFDRHFGGRDFDKAIVDHFAKEFQEKYKIDIKSNPKALVRLAAAAEKMKKVLSANAQAPISVESIMNDVDVSGSLKREDLEQLLQPLLARATAPLEQALAETKLTIEDIDAVEMVGGCTRVPSLKDAVSKFFGKTLSFTLNQDEAVARGCAYNCAILSPSFRVRDFIIHDIVLHPIEFHWEESKEIPDEGTSLTVFDTGNSWPSTKVLTFYRKQPFDIEARYRDVEKLPGSVNPWIGRFAVKNVKPTDSDDFMCCKLKAKLTLNGTLICENGLWTEEIEVEEPLPESKPEAKEGDAEAMETDEAPKTRLVKKQVKKGDLPIVMATSVMDQTVRDAATDREGLMFMEDKLVMDTEDKKNELESYIYELRGKIEEQYAEFASEDEKDKLRAKLESSEDWLYDEGDDATKAAYVSKMDEIRFIAGPIVARYLEKVEEERQAALKIEEEKAAKRKAENEAAKKAEEARKPATPATNGEAKSGDVEMEEASVDEMD